MSAYWNTLRPLEKRVVVGAGVLFFVVLNLIFVIPHLSDVDGMYFRLETAKRTIAKYQAEFSLTNSYAKGLRELDRKGVLDVPQEEQSYQFANSIQVQAVQSSVEIKSASRPTTQTNQTFIEKTQNVSVEANEEHLVDFLFNLGSGASLIRVRDLGLRPDGSHMKLVATARLVASYQKKAAGRPAASATKTAGANAELSPLTTAAAPEPAKTLASKPPTKTKNRP